MHPGIGESRSYYRLVESYRNALGEVRQRTIISVGFMEELSASQIKQVQSVVNDRIKGQKSLFEADALVVCHASLVYSRLISEKK